MNYQQLLDLFKKTHRELQQRAARSVDTSLVIRNWLFGWYIVEFEQGGAERAEPYGKNLINHIGLQEIQQTRTVTTLKVPFCLKRFPRAVRLPYIFHNFPCKFFSHCTNQLYRYISGISRTTLTSYS